jgi:H+/Cl- antiporter ClcA/CBS domain-containing protein
MTAIPPSRPAGIFANPFLPAIRLANLPPILSWLQPAPETVVLLLAVAIGGGTGLAVVLFHHLIEWIHNLMLQNLMGAIAPLGAWTLACVPTLGGVIVGLMRWYWKDFGPGISTLISTPQTLVKTSPAKATVKSVAASVSLGSGASLGPEGPSVEIGANIGAVLGQALRVSQERQRLLLGAGAAAGLAAGFNAPIAGVFFALEVVVGSTFAASAVSVILLSSVVASLIAQIGLGAQPAFTLPSYEVRSPLELPLYLGLGLFACLVALAYTQLLQFTQRLFKGEIPGFHWMKAIPIPVRPILGGLCVGITALQFPQVLGIGYETVEAMLRDVEFSLLLLCGLLVIKLLMTAISLGSGLVGGLFAPAMFLGASLGAAYGKVVAAIFPVAAGGIAAPPAYAMVGMAAVLAASVRAPLTAILMLFELTRDYRIILPLMAAVGLSVWLMDRLKPVTHNRSALQSPGETTKLDEDAELLQQISVLQAMHRDFLTVTNSLSVLAAGLLLTEHQARSALVVSETGELVGIVTLQDINQAIVESEETATTHTPRLAEQRLEDICSHDVLRAYSDESLAEAEQRMATRGLHQLPVVHRNDSHHVLGILAREDIALAKSLAVTRKLLHPHAPAIASVTTPESTEPVALFSAKKTA